jgi:hypothetical protein
MSEFNRCLEAVKAAKASGDILAYEIEGGTIMVETEQGWSVLYRDNYTGGNYDY